MDYPTICGLISLLSVVAFYSAKLYISDRKEKNEATDAEARKKYGDIYEDMLSYISMVKRNEDLKAADYAWYGEFVKKGEEYEKSVIRNAISYAWNENKDKSFLLSLWRFPLVPVEGGIWGINTMLEGAEFDKIKEEFSDCSFPIISYLPSRSAFPLPSSLLEALEEQERKTAEKFYRDYRYCVVRDRITDEGVRTIHQVTPITELKITSENNLIYMEEKYKEYTVEYLDNSDTKNAARLEDWLYSLRVEEFTVGVAG